VKARRERRVMPRRLRSHFTAGVALALLLLFGAHPAAAQSAKQQVPGNPAPPPAPAQPIPFSHKTHLAIELSCKDCHSNPEPGNLMTYPASAKCMECHEVVATNKPSIQKLAQFAKSGQPISWVRVYRVLPGVNWGHRKHLQARMQCVMCHGDVSQLDSIAITTSVTSMASCIGCHQAHSAPTACRTCHSWPAN
jgi:hypothetical protein